VVRLLKPKMKGRSKMRENDFDEFAALLQAAFDVLGKTPAAKVVSPTAQALFFQALAEYPMPQVRAALAAHVKRGKFTPTPADVVEHIEASTNGDGRPGPEEAWAIALASQDERDTVVWTSETAQAWQLARQVMETSGPITARKTFTETYTRLIAAARAQRRPVAWSAHLGWDKAQQGLVLQRAVDQGLLPAPSVAGLLPAPEVPDSALSLEGRAQLAKVKQMLADGAAERQRKLDAEFDRRNESEAEFKRNLNQRVAEYQHFARQVDQVQVVRAEGETVQQAAER
jgi:hypothetical protein